MLGPATQQLLFALSQVPKERKSEYESRLQAELTALAEVGQSWKNRVLALGLSDWWSNPDQKYNFWLTSTPDARVESAARPDNVIYGGGFRMPVSSEFVLGMLDAAGAARGIPNLSGLISNSCPEPNCPLR